MNIGELFIKLGIKTEGLAQISVVKEKVTKSITQAGVAASKFGKIFGKLKETYTKVSDKVKTFSQKLQESRGRLGDFINKIKVAQLETLAFAGALVALTKKASDYAATLKEFNSVTGMSSQYLQGLAQDAAASGIEFGEVEESLKGLQSRMLDVQMGRGDISPFGKLGIDPNSDPSAVIEQLKTKLNTMGPAMGANFARQLGLSDHFISFLKEAKKLPPANRALLLSDKEIDNLKKFNIYFNRTFDDLKRIMQRVSLQVLPVTEAIMFAIERLGLLIQRIGKGWDTLSEKIHGFKEIVIGVLGLFALLMFPETVGLIGFLAVLDDISAFMNGDKSVIGAYVELYEHFDEVIQGLIITVEELWDAFSFKDVLNGATETIKGWASDIGKMFGSGDLEATLKAKSAATSGVANNSSNQNNNVQINVNGAGKPENVATEVAKKLKGITSNTMYQQPVGGI